MRVLLIILTLAATITFTSAFFEFLFQLRWCRAMTRGCAKKKFSVFVNDLLNVTSPNAEEGVGGGNNATEDAQPAAEQPSPASEDAVTRRKRRVLELTILDQGYFRAKRDGPSGGCGDDNCGMPAKVETGENATAEAGVADGNVTGNTEPPPPPEVTIPPSLPTPEPPIFKANDLEETFYSCLDEIGPHRCLLYMFQRCNWHDGTSETIKKYCSKWKVPCLPCNAGHK